MDGIWWNHQLVRYWLLACKNIIHSVLFDFMFHFHGQIMEISMPFMPKASSRHQSLLLCLTTRVLTCHWLGTRPLSNLSPPTLVPQEIWQNNSTEWIVLGIPALFQMIGLTALANELVSIPQIYTTTLWRTPKKVRPCWAPLSLACPHAVVTTMHCSSVFHIFHPSNQCQCHPMSLSLSTSANVW